MRRPRPGAALTPAELDHWWLEFHDPALNALEDEAFRNGPDAKTAAARILEARAVRSSAVAQTLPQGQIQANASRQSQSNIGPPVSSLFPIGGVYETETAALNVSWELDLFGRLAEERKRARSDLQAARFNVEGTRASLAASVADTYFQIAGLNIQIADARETVRIQQQLADITTARAKIGIAATSEADRVYGDLSQAKATAEDLEGQLAYRASRTDDPDRTRRRAYRKLGHPAPGRRGARRAGRDSGSLARTTARRARVVQGVDAVGGVLFGMLRIIMYVAPLGAFGGMAYSVGLFGIKQLANLAYLIGCFYVTGTVFVFGLLGLVLALCGLNIFKLFGYLWDEFLLVLGTSSSETALPTLMAKLERLGCARPLVGLVIPLGYAFNLDGTSIYFTMAIAYIVQALGIPLSWGDYAVICGVLLLTSKGAAAVTGGGFITLAATLTALSGKVPVTGIVLVFAVDRFMSEGRAIFNLFGNAVATIVVARWEGQLDLPRARSVLAGQAVAEIPVDAAEVPS